MPVTCDKKHSYDIARPNQKACGTCSRCPGGVAFLHYPMMDNAVLEKLRVKKEKLVQSDEAQQLTLVCEQ
jgi:hypothetical protein